VDLAAHLLWRCKRENLFRLAHAMGLRLPANTKTGTLVDRIERRARELQTRDWLQRLRERHG
jgi:hypothetical protein